MDRGPSSRAPKYSSARRVLKPPLVAANEALLDGVFGRCTSARSRKSSARMCSLSSRGISASEGVVGVGKAVGTSSSGTSIQARSSCRGSGAPSGKGVIGGHSRLRPSRQKQRESFFKKRHGPGAPRLHRQRASFGLRPCVTIASRLPLSARFFPLLTPVPSRQQLIVEVWSRAGLRSHPWLVLRGLSFSRTRIMTGAGRRPIEGPSSRRRTPWLSCFQSGPSIRWSGRRYHALLH